MKPHILRPDSRPWHGQLGLSIGCIVLISISAVFYFTTAAPGSAVFGGLLAALLAHLVRSIIKTRRDYDLISSDGRLCFGRGGRETVSWDEVTCVWEVGTGEMTELRVATKEKTLWFSALCYDLHEVRQFITRYAPPESLEPDAYGDLLDWASEISAKRLEELNTPYELKSRADAIVGWITGSLFASFGVLACLNGQLWAGLLFVPFLLLALYLILNANRMFFDDVGVTLVSRLTCHQLRWADVHAAFAIQGGIKLQGQGKHLVIPTLFLSGPKTAEAWDFLEAQLAARALVVKEDSATGVVRSGRGTKVRKADAFPDGSRRPCWK